MSRSSKIKIVDLEPTELGIEQELSLEEAKKIVGGAMCMPPDTGHPEPFENPPKPKKPKP